MQTLPATVIATRSKAAKHISQVVRVSDGKTERELRDAILARFSEEQGWYLGGWYDPPEGGVAVLCDAAPYTRLQFDSLRNPTYFADTRHQLAAESVSILYVSPVERATGMIGDIGCTLYRGEDSAIQEHLKSCFELMYNVANTIEVGMEFRDIYHGALAQFKAREKKIGWMTTSHDPLQINLGHTVPGSLGECILSQGTFEEVREAIRTKRLYINAEESFKVPNTGAFTFEARLTDLSGTLPNAFFHFIVAFEGGVRDVRTDFDEIFTNADMPYML